MRRPCQVASSPARRTWKRRSERGVFAAAEEAPGFRTQEEDAADAAADDQDDHAEPDASVARVTHPGRRTRTERYGRAALRESPLLSIAVRTAIPDRGLRLSRRSPSTVSYRSPLPEPPSCRPSATQLDCGSPAGSTSAPSAANCRHSLPRPGSTALAATPDRRARRARGRGRTRGGGGGCRRRRRRGQRGAHGDAEHKPAVARVRCRAGGFSSTNPAQSSEQLAPRVIEGTENVAASATTGHGAARRRRTAPCQRDV